MSHFSSIATKFRDKECLVAALTELGLTPKTYDAPHPLRGYYGDQNEYSAEIIVSGSSKQLMAEADIGFKWHSTQGCYEVIHDAYETIPRLGANFFTHKLMGVYGEKVVRAKAAELQERLGNCTIASTTAGTQQTLRLSFAAHQQIQQVRR